MPRTRSNKSTVTAFGVCCCVALTVPHTYGLIVKGHQHTAARSYRHHHHHYTLVSSSHTPTIPLKAIIIVVQVPQYIHDRTVVYDNSTHTHTYIYGILHVHIHRLSCVFCPLRLCGTATHDGLPLSVLRGPQEGLVLSDVVHALLLHMPVQISLVVVQYDVQFDVADELKESFAALHQL